MGINGKEEMVIIFAYISLTLSVISSDEHDTPYTKTALNWTLAIKTLKNEKFFQLRISSNMFCTFLIVNAIEHFFY